MSIEIRCIKEKDAYSIIEGLAKQLLEDGFVTVRDVYQLAKTIDKRIHAFNFRDMFNGWIDLKGVTVIGHMNRYVLSLPEPVDLASILTPIQLRKMAGLEKNNEEVKLNVITTRKTILDKAKTCVCGQRVDDYGSPEDNFTIIADLWSIYTGHKLTAVDVSMMMSMLKIARIKTGTATEDSFIDLAGYAACGGEISANRKGDK